MYNWYVKNYFRYIIINLIYLLTTPLFKSVKIAIPCEYIFDNIKCIQIWIFNKLMNCLHQVNNIYYYIIYKIIIDIIIIIYIYYYSIYLYHYVYSKYIIFKIIETIYI